MTPPRGAGPHAPGWHTRQHTCAKPVLCQVDGQPDHSGKTRGNSMSFPAGDPFCPPFRSIGELAAHLVRSAHG